MLHHLALGARDVERVAAFYRDVLGLAEMERHHRDDGALRSVWLDLGSHRGDTPHPGGVLMIEHTSEPPRRVEGVGAGLFLIALCVRPEERAAMEERLEQAGAVIESRTAFTSYTRDPEGNRVAISHHS